MTRRLLLAALVLAVVGLLWWLARQETPAPLAVRFLHRTNNSSGQVRYLIAVTNLSRQMLFGKFDGKSYLPPRGAPGMNTEASFSDFELGGGSRLVVAWQPNSPQSRQAVLHYRVRGPLAQWKEWLHEKISPGTNPSRRLDTNAPSIFIDLPPD